MKNILMAISGPSGVGKGTLVKALLARRKDLIESVSCTTRAPRKGERDGREYFFLKREEFLSRIEKGVSQCVLVMIVPPSEEELKRRLKGRNSETDEEIERRLSRMEYEFSKKDEYDYIVVNDALDGAESKLEEIIDKEKNR